MEDGGNWVGVATLSDNHQVHCSMAVAHCNNWSICGLGRYWDHKVGVHRRKSVPLCYVLSKGEYMVNAAMARDSVKRWVHHNHRLGLM